MLEEMKPAQQEVIKEDHVIELVYGEHDHKPCKELPELEPASEAVPNAITTAPIIIRKLNTMSTHPIVLAP